MSKTHTSSVKSKIEKQVENKGKIHMSVFFIIQCWQGCKKTGIFFSWIRSPEYLLLDLFYPSSPN